jgi:hypothetical protein
MRAPRRRFRRSREAHPRHGSAGDIKARVSAPPGHQPARIGAAEFPLQLQQQVRIQPLSHSRAEGSGDGAGVDEREMQGAALAEDPMAFFQQRWEGGAE